MNTNNINLYNTNQDDFNRCNCPKCKGRAGTKRVCFNFQKLAELAEKKGLARTAGLLLLLSCLCLPGQATAGMTRSAMETTPSSQMEKDCIGYLKVFSSTQESQWGEGSFYYPHTGYRIYDCNGNVVKWVENHNTSIDENPETVQLAPGVYTVWARSEKAGYVNVPVIIKRGAVTTLWKA